MNFLKSVIELLTSFCALVKQLLSVKNDSFDQIVKISNQFDLPLDRETKQKMNDYIIKLLLKNIKSSYPTKRERDLIKKFVKRIEKLESRAFRTFRAFGRTLDRDANAQTHLFASSGWATPTQCARA